MSNWNYAQNRLAGERFTRYELGAFYLEARNTTSCAFCHYPLEVLIDRGPDRHLIHEYLQVPFDAPENHRNAIFTGPSMHLHALGTHIEAELFEDRLQVCPVCGWWISFRETLESAGRGRTVRSYGGVGALKLLSLADVSVPIEEVRSFLCARYERRFELHPRLFEETVASVFRDLGFHSRVTAYSGDDGVDVILDGPAGTIGVQVKRYSGAIDVSQIRELTGALVVNGLTKGMFVTTSDFQSGAAPTAEMSGRHGYPIELYDADRFFDALQIAQRAAFDRSRTTLLGSPISLTLVATRTGDANNNVLVSCLVDPRRRMGPASSH